MAKNKSLLSGGQYLAKIQSIDPILGTLLKNIIKGVNTVSTNASVGAQGEVDAAPPLNAVNIKGTLSGDTLTAPGEMLHLTLTHNAPVNKGIHYFTEVDTDPNFPQPHVFHMGASRTLTTMLPANGDDTNPVTYYVRSYHSQPGSQPQKPQVFGGQNGAIKVRMTGSTNMSLLPSTGSGTAAANGTQGGSGFGKVLNRPAPQPKRAIAQF